MVGGPSERDPSFQLQSRALIDTHTEKSEKRKVM